MVHVPRRRFAIHRLLVLCGVALMLAAGDARAQDQPETVFTSSTELVVLHVTVRDKHGQYLTSLPREAFHVIEDGRPQELQFFERADAPVTVGLLIDSSGSMQANREQVIAAAMAFAKACNPDDELFAAGFNEEVISAMPVRFTSDLGVLSQAMTRSIGARGQTALYDALLYGLDYASAGRRERKVLVVVSDGGDNASQAEYQQVLRAAQTSNAVIYTVAIIDPIEHTANPKILRELAQATGGESFTPKSVGEVDEVLARIAKDIRGGYTLGYTPSQSGQRDEFRRLRVVVEAPEAVRRGGLVIRTRTGYAVAAKKGERADAR